MCTYPTPCSHAIFPISISGNSNSSVVPALKKKKEFWLPTFSYILYWIQEELLLVLPWKCFPNLTPSHTILSDHLSLSTSSLLDYCNRIPTSVFASALAILCSFLNTAIGMILLKPKSVHLTSPLWCLPHGSIYLNEGRGQILTMACKLLCNLASCWPHLLLSPWLHPPHSPWSPLRILEHLKEARTSGLLLFALLGFLHPTPSK